MEGETPNFNIKAFLIEYENHRCLWDKVHLHFKDRLVRSKAKEDLIRQFGISDIKSLRKKIRSIRGTYNTEVRKIKDSKKSGSGTNETYVPKLVWFEVADRFLRQTTEIFSESNVRIDDLQDESEDVSMFATNDNDQELHRAIDVISPPPKKTYVKKPTKALFRKRQESSIDNAVKTLKEISQTQTNNEFIAFGNSVAMQLQNLPLTEALQLQSNITRTRISYIQSSQNSSYASSLDTVSTISTPAPSPQSEQVLSIGEVTQQFATEGGQREPEQLGSYFSNWAYQAL
ncbi:hypothetical protein RN001_006060 [Aquatica leii]|uniref:MADF domain-containing protein n=1 Tax=Aquatica leii TaxID=1421715 RepID=A0AAN7PKQ0_9COLE|nr:hypothetical protein RN001_006060 [Aquatica leii]